MKKYIQITTMVLLILGSAYFYFTDDDKIKSIVEPVSLQESISVPASTLPKKESKRKIENKSEQKIDDDVVSSIEEKKIDTTKKSLEFLEENKLTISEAESKIAARYKNSRAVITIDSSVLKKFSNDDFQKFMYEFSLDEGMTQQSVEAKSRYTDLFLEASVSKDSPFILEQLECGQAVCVASIQYNDVSEVKGIWMHFVSMEEATIRTMVVLGSKGKSFRENNRIGLIFPSTDEEAVILGRIGDG